MFCHKEAAHFVRFTDNCSECSVVSSIRIFLHYFIFILAYKNI